ncbi:MAG TPA: tetratricopeptide repeat protein, partial [Candidatus Acidoferrales bacterium]|nr:tetratricopeptide repeat protein [Candidatus Acidoferrales bacterium]
WSNLMLARKNYYRPVFLLWLLGNYEEFGTDPLGWHMSSLLLHLGSTVLLYLLALRLTRERFSALAASLVFGLHPVQVENVVWASCSTELLGSFLVLAAMLCYLRSLERAAQRAALLLASVFLFALAVMAKETAIIFPAIVFLHEWLGRPATTVEPPARSRGAALAASFVESLPFGVIAVIYLAARIAVLGALGTAVVTMTKQVWFQTIPRILQIYLLHVVWPARLSAFYDYPYITQFSVRTVVMPAALLVVLGILLFLAVRRSPAARLAAVWMVLPILTVLDIPVFPRGEFLHDRYLYHPLIGLSLLVGLGIAALERRWTSRTANWAIYSACGAVVLMMGAVTFHQTGYWTDNFALYTRGVGVAPRSGFANMNLGAVLLNRGQWNEAMAQFQKAIEYSPNLYLAHYDMGLGYYQAERYADAEACFKRAIAILPEYPESHLSLGMTYYHTHRLPEAVQELRKAIALNPSDPGYHFALGVMLKDSGDLTAAREELLEVLQLDPQQEAAMKQLREIEQRAAPAASGPAPAGPKTP